MKRSQKKQSERDIEVFLCEKVEELLKGHAYKFTSPGRRNVPDRICVVPGFCFFVEVKAPGETPSTAQEREMNRLAKLDQWVFAVNSNGGVLKVLDKMKGVIESD